MFWLYISIGVIVYIAVMSAVLAQMETNGLINRFREETEDWWTF